MTDPVPGFCLHPCGIVVKVAKQGLRYCGWRCAHLADGLHVHHECERHVKAAAATAAEVNQRREEEAGEASEEELQQGALLIKKWMDEQKQLMKDDWDLPIVVTGNERKGKSSIAFEMALYFDALFNPEEQIVFSADDFTRKATRLPKYRPLILDEAVSGGFSRDAGSGPNKRLAKFLTVCGDRNLVMFVLWPNIRWLDPILKEHRIRFNIHVERRFKTYAVAKFRLLRDDDEIVYDYPVTQFRFKFPRAHGPKWDRYKTAKRAFVDQVGRGRDDEVETARGDVLEAMRVQLRPIVRRLA